MITETIQLGTQTPQFASPTLFVEINQSQTRMFLGHGTQVDVYSIVTPETSSDYSDAEGHNNHGNTTHSSSSSEENNNLKDHNNKVHLNQVMDKIKFLDGNGKFKKLEVFLTSDFKKDFESKLPKHIMEKTKTHQGNFSHDSIQDLVAKHR